MVLNFDWEEFYYLAESLVGRKTRRISQEARLRAAISRAYYAVLIKARNHLRDVDKVMLPFDNSLHSFVINYYINSPKRGYKKIGRSLRTLRVNRNMVDYQDQVTKIFEISNQTLGLARSIITQLNRV